MKHLTIILAFLMTLSAPVSAQDKKKGLKAYMANDYAEAVKLLSSPAEGGDWWAQRTLGIMYGEGGNGIRQNYSTAVKWLRLAAAQEDVKAQGFLGDYYRNGKGVLQDNLSSYMWFNIAAANYKEKEPIAFIDWRALAENYRDRIAQEMTPAAIEKAQAMARECMSSNYTKCGY